MVEGLKIWWRGGVSSKVMGIICPPPLVEKGLIDLPKYGGIRLPTLLKFKGYLSSQLSIPRD